MLSTKILTAQEFLDLSPAQLSSVQELNIKIVAAPEKKKNKASKSLTRKSSKKEGNKKAEFSAMHLKIYLDNADQLTSLIHKIPEMPRLQVLDLSELYPSDQQWSSFYKILPHCFSVNRLKLKNNKIANITGLVRALPLNLRHLELCANNISDKQTLLDLLSSNSENSPLRWSLKIIDLDFNDFPDETSFDAIPIATLVKDQIKKNNDIAKSFKEQCLNNNSLNSLCEKYQSIDVRVEYDNNWGSLLHYAVYTENLDLLNSLLEKKINLNIRNFPDNQTVLEYAEFLLNQRYGKPPVQMKRDSASAEIAEDNKAGILNKIIAVLCVQFHSDKKLTIEPAIETSKRAKISHDTVPKTHSAEKSEKTKRRRSLSIGNASHSIFHPKPKEKTEKEPKGLPPIPELKHASKDTKESVSDMSMSPLSDMSTSPVSSPNMGPKS